MIRARLCCFLCGAIAGPLNDKILSRNFIQIGEGIEPLVTHVLFECAAQSGSFGGRTAARLLGPFRCTGRV